VIGSSPGAVPSAMGDLGTERHNPSTLRPKFEGGAAAGELKVKMKERKADVSSHRRQNK
jgi:hypothetical protein